MKKTSLLLLFFSIWLQAWLPMNAFSESHAVIFVYHHVSTRTPASTSVTPQQFEEHLNYLENNQFHVWSLTKIISHLQKQQPIPEKTVAFTFDDAYESVFTEVFPRFQKRNWPFIVFVNTDAIDKGYDPYMSWKQLRVLSESGVEIGNHSRTHDHLIRQNPEESLQQWEIRVKSDIADAQKRLKEKLPSVTNLFAYPYGEHNLALEAIVQELGFYGLGQQSGALGPSSNLYRLPRYPIAARFAQIKDFILRANTKALPLYELHPTARVFEAFPVPFELEFKIGEGMFFPEKITCFAPNHEPLKIQWVSSDKRHAKIKLTKALPSGRSKINCTVPHLKKPGVFYWYSHLVIIKQPNGSWHQE